MFCDHSGYFRQQACFRGIVQSIAQHSSALLGLATSAHCGRSLKAMNATDVGFSRIWAQSSSFLQLQTGASVSKPKSVAIYTRVSTDGQSVENQRRELLAVAERRGWEVVQEYSDHGISGAQDRDKRPAFDRMLKG